MKTLGEIGYEKWRSLLEPHANAGLPTWSKLPIGSKMCWEEIANTIVEASGNFGSEPVQAVQP